VEEGRREGKKEEGRSEGKNKDGGERRMQCYCRLFLLLL
jgi:hypothetical protein